MEGKPGSSGSADASELFTVHVQMRAEPEVAPGQPEWLTDFRVIYPVGTAIVEINRFIGDLPGRAIGKFQMALGRETINALRKSASACDFSKAGSTGGEGGGGDAENQLTVEYATPNHSYTKSFSTRDSDVKKAVAPLLDASRPLINQTLGHPLSAVQAYVEIIPASGNAGQRFRYSVKNIGSEPLIFRSPGALADLATPAAYVRVAKVRSPQPGVAANAPSWEILPLVPKAGDEETRRNSIIRLGPGETFSMESASWKGATPGSKCIAQAVFHDYIGPTRDQMIEYKSYAVRGVCFSKILEFESGK